MMKFASPTYLLRRAFTLIEVLVVVALLSVIILGLVAMFSQTQRAYTLGLSQVDTMEGGRAITDMITREVSQVAPSQLTNAVNFFVQIPLYTPLLQNLDANPPPGRLNLFEDLYYLAKENQTWVGYGYHISTPANGVGTLYRYERRSTFGQSPEFLFYPFRSDALSDITTNMNRVLDNVVHFKVRAFDTNGFWITNDIAKGADVRFSTVVAPGEIGYYLMSNSVVPASIEFELGILEERTAARARAIANPARRHDYLTNQAGKVHIFRWRVPVRNVDPTAYQ